MWEEYKTWGITCDGPNCNSIKSIVSLRRPFALPDKWETRTYSGGGHYGLPHHTKNYCPKCAKTAAPSDV